MSDRSPWFVGRCGLCGGLAISNAEVDNWPRRYTLVMLFTRDTDLSLSPTLFSSVPVQASICLSSHWRYVTVFTRLLARGRWGPNPMLSNDIVCLSVCHIFETRTGQSLGDHQFQALVLTAWCLWKHNFALISHITVKAINSSRITSYASMSYRYSWLQAANCGPTQCRPNAVQFIEDNNSRPIIQTWVVVVVVGVVVVVLFSLYATLKSFLDENVLLVVTSTVFGCLVTQSKAMNHKVDVEN